MRLGTFLLAAAFLFCLPMHADADGGGGGGGGPEIAKNPPSVTFTYDNGRAFELAAPPFPGWAPLDPGSFIQCGRAGKTIVLPAPVMVGREYPVFIAGDCFMEASEKGPIGIQAADGYMLALLDSDGERVSEFASIQLIIPGQMAAFRFDPRYRAYTVQD